MFASARKRVRFAAVFAAFVVLALGASCTSSGEVSPSPAQTAAATTPAPATTAAATPGGGEETPTCPPPSGEAPEADTMKSYENRPPMTIDTAKTYTAVVKTVRGDFKIELRPDLAPEHVNSFIFLAREGFYDGVTFHRVLPGFVAQTGDPTGTGAGGPGYNVRAEFSSQPFVRGVVGMARAQDPDSAGSQWFVTYDDAPHLNGQYTVFGFVTEGMDVVDCLTPRDPTLDPSAPPGDAIITIEILED
jgi:peptidylprolyl isomerase